MLPMVHLFVIVCATLCSNCVLAHSPTSLSSEEGKPSCLRSSLHASNHKLSFAYEPSLCASACVTWLQGLPCTLVPRTFFFPHPLVFVVTKMNSRTCPIRRAARVPLPDRNPFVVQQLRTEALPAHHNAHAICAHCAGLCRLE